MTESAGATGQVERMRAAVRPVLVLGPDFLAGKRHADDMANTMVHAVQTFVSQERARADDVGSAPEASSDAAREARELEALFSELYTCGSGYLANRCGADCVARTMTQVVGEFGHLTTEP